MPAQELQKQLDTLREQLEHNPPLSEAERDDLHALMAQIESEIQLETATQNASIADGVNRRHPAQHRQRAGQHGHLTPRRTKKPCQRWQGFFICKMCMQALVGASLLAKASCQSTSSLNDTPHSRAGSLSHWISHIQDLY